MWEQATHRFATHSNPEVWRYAHDLTTRWHAALAGDTLDWTLLGQIRAEARAVARGEHHFAPIALYAYWQTIEKDYRALRASSLALDEPRSEPVMKSLPEIKAEVDQRAALLGAAGHPSLPTYGSTEDSARPHIEVDARGYHFVVVERGVERSRFTTSSFDDLLYQIFQSVTFALAVNHERAHRIATQDCRRGIFQRQLELLAQLSPLWAEREAADHQRILRQYPFDDWSAIRATLTRELRAAGHSPETAWRLACERYPLPVPA